MIIGLSAGFWICISWVGLLFLGFCFLSVSSESVMAILPVLLVCSGGMFRESLLVLEAGVLV